MLQQLSWAGSKIPTCNSNILDVTSRDQFCGQHLCKLLLTILWNLLFSTLSDGMDCVSYRNVQSHPVLLGPGIRVMLRTYSVRHTMHCPMCHGRSVRFHNKRTLACLLSSLLFQIRLLNIAGTMYQNICSSGSLLMNTPHDIMLETAKASCLKHQQTLMFSCQYTYKQKATSTLAVGRLHRSR